MNEPKPDFELGKFMGKSVRFAPRSTIKEYALEVRRILDAIGHPEAWVSDDSDFGDFCFDVGELDDLLRPLGLAGMVSDSTLVHEAAKMLRAAIRSPSKEGN